MALTNQKPEPSYLCHWFNDTVELPFKLKCGQAVSGFTAIQPGEMEGRKID